jgi:sortase (surface protein transpeptidase)
LEQFSDNGKRRGRLLPWARLSFSIIGCLSVVIISVLALVVIFKSNVKAEHSPVTVYVSKPTEDSTDISKKRPAVNTYKYADDEPKSIEIHDIGVKNAILPLGLDKKNTLMAPENAYTAGWYNQSSKPGQKGAMLMDGHGSESGTYYGLFSRLSELEENDKITITRGDDRKFDFAVVKVENVPVDEVNMAKTLKPYEGAEQGLNIISCTGSWIKNHTTLDRRVILFAVPVNA